MVKIVVISVSAPPKTGPESLQVYKYLKYLKKYFHITLITTEGLNYGWKKVENNLILNIDRIEVKIIKNRILNFILNKILKKNHQFSEENIFLNSDKKLLKKLKKNPPKLIYSRSASFVSAKLAFKIKAQLKVPWIMHLSDPWTDNSYSQTTLEEMEWERKSFETADVITMTSRETIQFYSNKYPQYQKKFHLILNSYDSDDIAPAQLNKSNKLRLVFSGNQYKERNILPVLKAIKLFSSEQRENIEFHIYGYIDENVKKEIDMLQLQNLKMFGSRSYAEVIKELPKAHILVTVDKPAENPVDLVYLPSKISDYLMVKRKILNITSANSATQKIIKYPKGVSFQHNEEIEMKKFINECIKKWDASDMDYFIVHEENSEFDVMHNVRKLKDIIQTLIR